MNATGRPHWRELIPSVCAGVDEVGRGCLFGPVFAAAVVLPAHAFEPLIAAGLNDSKQLSARARAHLDPMIRRLALGWGIGQASAAEVDRCGIRPATELAMIRALQRLPQPPAHLLVDGSLPLRGWSGPQITLVGGDRCSEAIAAASVIAKHGRDQLMQRLALRFPGYGLERHKGYGTVRHRQAILSLGPTPLHRRSFLRRLGVSA